MISKITISINKEINEVVEILAKTEVPVRADYIARWHKTQKTKCFTFRIDNFGLIPTWTAKCYLNPNRENSKVQLITWFYPPFWSLPFLAFVLGGYIYSVVQFGIHNYGAAGFWPSIVVPSFLFILMLIFWTVMAYFNSKRLKRKIEKALSI